MGGVDLADQRISYYHPNLRSYRNWIPMFLQIISLVRNNSYLVYRANTEKPVSHKEFTLNMVETLLLQVEFFHDNPELPTDVIASTDGSPQSQLSLSQKSTNTAQNATSSVASSHCSARSLSSMPRSFPWIESKPRYRTKLTLDDYNERLEGEKHKHCRVNTPKTMVPTSQRRRQAK